MSITITNLNEKKSTLIAKATEVLQRSSPSSPEYKALLKDIDDVTEHISMLSQIERSLKGSPAPVAAPAPVLTGDEKQIRRAKLNAAWRSFLANRPDQSPEYRDILTSDGGSALVPKEFAGGFLAQALKYYAPLTQYVRTKWLEPGQGMVVKVPFGTDTSAGLTLITEGGSVAEVDPAFGSSTVGNDDLSAGTIKFSWNLLQDSSFDLEVLLTELASIRVGRGYESILTNGLDSSGNATPNNPGIVSVAQVALTTASLVSGLSWTNLVDVFDATDAAYLPRAVWMMTSKTRNALLRLEDGTGRPYFTPAPTADGMDMLLGKPIVINQSLAQLGTANGIPVVFGSLYDGYQMVGSPLRVQNLRERYADSLESAIIPTTRIGSTGLAPGALQSIKLAAS